MSSDLWLGLATDVVTIAVVLGMLVFFAKLISEILKGFSEK